MFKHFFTRFTAGHKTLIFVALFLLVNAVSFAQTAEPVAIDIPVGDSIGYLNDWIAIFAPIMLFVGMIPVALGVLRYITKLFASAFGSGG